MSNDIHDHFLEYMHWWMSESEAVPWVVRQSYEKLTECGCIEKLIRVSKKQ